jgi:hypothetical protein
MRVSLRCSPAFNRLIKRGRGTKLGRGGGMYNLVVSSGVDTLSSLVGFPSNLHPKTRCLQYRNLTTFFPHSQIRRKPCKDGRTCPSVSTFTGSSWAALSDLFELGNPSLALHILKEPVWGPEPPFDSAQDRPRAGRTGPPL